MLRGLLIATDVSLQDVTEHLTILGAEDYDAFLAMLESDRKPGRALRDAARFYKRNVKR